MVCGQGPVCDAADAAHGLGCFRHERCIEFSRVHTGGLVEPNSRWCLGFDVVHRHLLESVGRLQCAWRKSTGHSVTGFAACSIHRVLFHSRHRQPAEGRHSRAATELNKRRSIHDWALIGPFSTLRGTMQFKGDTLERYSDSISASTVEVCGHSQKCGFGTR